MLVKVHTAAVEGLNAQVVTCEVNDTRGVNYTLVGLPDNSVRESQERVKAAIANSGMDFPVRNFTINLTPANVRKVGSAYDLPICVGILATNETVKPESLEGKLMLGELGLDGSLHPVAGALSIAIMAREKGYEAMILPKANAEEAAIVDRLKVYGAENLREVVDILNQAPTAIEPTIVDTRAEFAKAESNYEHDFSDVKGQAEAKRAMEVAAAGGHNIILVGPPGSGKSMLAKRLPSILPPLSMKESLETTKIYSVAGLMGRTRGLITERPFRSPHHTVSQVAVVGGGASPKPGEISLAHNGVLYMDELPEFPRAVLEVLRQPLEDGEMHVSRASYNVVYPAKFIFAASMNPCPCGYFGDPNHTCQCPPGSIARYVGKISGPLMDRIDIQVNVLPLSYDDLATTSKAEPSQAVRERVVRARRIQQERFAAYEGIHCNAQMTSAMLREFVPLTPENQELMRNAMTRMKFSARAYDRLLKLARTIADLAGSDTVEADHLREAFHYRNLDRQTAML